MSSQTSSGPRPVPGYVIEARIGGGGSAEVFRARVAGSQQRVALKRVHVGSAEAARATRSEAALLATLDHPNLIRLHEVIPQHDCVVLVMDLAAGGSLTDLVAARGRLAVGEVVAAMAPIGAALASVHAEGITHGDLTPANVLFTQIGLPLLADLGVARICGDVRAVRSTPAFVDPAVANGAIPAPSSDVFMLAATTFFALTGEVLWPGEETEQVLAAARTGRLSLSGPLSSARVPSAIEDLLRTALSLEPQRRGTAADFALELRHAARPVGIELTAGRAQPTAVPVRSADSPRAHAPRHAAAPGGRATAVPDPSLLQAAAVGANADEHPGRPGFGRPALTHGVRAPAITAIRSRRHRWLRPLLAAPLWGRRLALVLAVCVASGAAAVGVRAAVPAMSGTAGSGRSASTPMAAGHVPSTMGTSGTAGQRTDPLADPAGALRTLGALRQRAFAQRDSALLANVYLPGPLLDADRAMLATLVPRGCALNGAATTYTSVTVVRRSPDRATVTAVVAVAASELTCPGKAPAAVPAASARRLQVTVVAVAGHPRIADQRAAG